MNRFVQLHLLTSYPPSNLNRDDLGRPKTAVMGGALRLRVSSQSLKRAWRTSDLFRAALDGHVGTRTKEMGREVYRKLVERDVPGKQAKDWSKSIAGVFGKLKKENSKDPLALLDIEQLAHFGPEELAMLDALVARLAKEDNPPSDDDLRLLRKRPAAADIALFGRMLAADPGFNVEAAAQVAHAITVHKVQVEDDFFTAVDDLNDREEDLGAGHMGETEFGAGVFYTYICIDRNLLFDNLSGDVSLWEQSLRALTECAARVGPTGKQNSFASRAFASYILAEKGDEQPRSLSVAFLSPVSGYNILEDTIKVLTDTRDAFETAYGASSQTPLVMNAASGEGTLAEILDYVASD